MLGSVGFLWREIESLELLSAKGHMIIVAACWRTV